MATFAKTGTSSANVIRTLSHYNKHWHAVYGVDGVLTLKRVMLELHQDVLGTCRPVPKPAITADNFGATRETQALTSYNAEQAGIGWFMALNHDYDAADRSKELGNELGMSAQPYMGAGVEIDRKHFTVLEMKGAFNAPLSNYFNRLLLGSRRTALHGQFRWTVWTMDGNRWALHDATNGWISGVWDEGLPDEFTDENGRVPEWAHPRPWHFYAATFTKNIAQNMKMFRRNPATPQSEMWALDFYIPAEFHEDFWFGARKALGNCAGFTGQQWAEFYKAEGITPHHPIRDYDAEVSGV